MDARGLVDPKNKPFGRVLPLEVQVKIMFWVHCFITIDKRKKVVQELKGLPKCDLTLLPQNLGQGQYWNQIVLRLQAPRSSYCHHCHRLTDHQLSVREKNVFFLGVGWNPTLRLFLFGQIGMMVEMAREPSNLDNLMNQGIAFVIRKFQCRLPDTPIGRRPVMIGRRKASYDTIDKVMKRLDLIMKVMDAMEFIPIDIR